MTSERELFEKEYPAKEVANNPFIASEAVGYLKHWEKPTQSRENG